MRTLIETRRLILRAFESDDVDAAFGALLAWVIFQAGPDGVDHGRCTGTMPLVGDPIGETRLLRNSEEAERTLRFVGQHGLEQRFRRPHGVNRRPRFEKPAEVGGA